MYSWWRTVSTIERNLYMLFCHVPGRDNKSFCKGMWYPSEQTQNICIIFVQRRPNVSDVGSTLYKCYTNVLCLLSQVGLCFRSLIMLIRLTDGSSTYDSFLKLDKHYFIYARYAYILWNSMTLTSFVFTKLANTMKYGGGFLYNLVFTEWRHCFSQLMVKLDHQNAYIIHGLKQKI